MVLQLKSDLFHQQAVNIEIVLASQQLLPNAFNVARYLSADRPAGSQREYKAFGGARWRSMCKKYLVRAPRQPADSRP